MIDHNISLTSLCYVFIDTFDNGLRLSRIADIENGILHKPFKSERPDNYYENRDRLYHNSGPTIAGTIGVWDWSAEPNRNNPEYDYIKTYYVSNKSPVRIVVTKNDSLEDLVKQLKGNSIYSHTYLCDTLFCCTQESDHLTGLLCRAVDFEIVDSYVKLKEDIYVLPYYTINVNDVFNYEDKHLRFFRKLQIGEPTGYFSIGNTQELVKNLILERLSWSFFKEYVGATKAEWRNSKIILEKILSQSLYDMVSEKLKCNSEEAKQIVNDFVLRANDLLDVENIDVDVLARIAINHDELRTLCEESISKKWKESHRAEIAQVEAEVASIKAKAQSEVDNIKRNLHDVETELTSAHQTKNNLFDEIETAQKRLGYLLAENERYEKLGYETLVAVRKKISEAQNDMAGFITELSVILPQVDGSTSSKKSVPLYDYESASIGLYSEDDIELSETWSDELNSLCQNIGYSLSIDSELASMLSAFLYATHINNIPLLIAGPAGREIAEAVSASLYATEAGKLYLGNEYYYGIVNDIEKYDEPLVAVQNMFCKGWNDELPQLFTKLNKQIVWTHPYVEDMLIEPKGIYNYMLPVLSECFVGAISTLDLWPSKRAENFKAYVSLKKQPLKISAFKKLKLSKLLFNQLTFVLSETKYLLDQPSREKDLEVLFGLLPLCVVTGQIDVLKDVIDNEAGISSDVKAEVSRYIEEE